VNRVAGDGSSFFRDLLHYKLPVITLCSVVLFPMHNQCYVVVNTITKAVPLHALEALGGRGIAPTHSRPRH
jgi:hypothetical protein